MRFWRWMLIFATGSIAETQIRKLRQAPQEVNIQVTAQLFSARLYDFGKNEGDQTLPSSLDVGQRVELQQPLTFFGKQYPSIYVLSNGAIGFDQEARNYRSNVLKSGPPLIVPFWNRNDLRKGGKIYFREVTAGRILERAQSEIRYQYENNAKPQSVFLVTWENVRPPNNDEKQGTNTIQAALIVTDNGTFANFIYKSLGWSQGAEAGFSKGQGSYFYELPGSSGKSIDNYLRDFGNTGVPGEWIFRIDQPDRIVRCKPGVKGDTCDTNCAENEWGNDCFNCCHCENGACDAQTGACKGPCKQCWYGGPSCEIKDQQCKPGNTKCGVNAVSFTETDRCGDSAVRCRCLGGYSGDGITCSDANECLDKNRCGPNSKCVNTPGRFYCECLPGFTGNGTFCIRLSLINPDEEEKFLIKPITSKNNESLIEFKSTNVPVILLTSQSSIEGAPHQSTHFQLENVYTLPNEKKSKMVFKLNFPIKIFGKERDKLTIFSSGFVALDDPPEDLDANEDLETLNIRGFAPLFSRIDLTKNNQAGKVTVYETVQSDILDDASNIVRQSFSKPNSDAEVVGNFSASSVVTITFENVSTLAEKSAQQINTFLILLISGYGAQKQRLTFAEYVYADIQWADDAQALILTDDPTNVFVLPGSGTEEVLELAKTSNIGSPGEWIYRIDQETIRPCPSHLMQPPYCQSESVLAPVDISDPSSDLEGFIVRTTNNLKPTLPPILLKTGGDTRLQPNSLGIESKPINIDFPSESIDNTDLPPLQLFTVARTPKPKIVHTTIKEPINKFENKKQRIDSSDFDSKLAIIIPACIVAVWMLILIIVAVIVLYRRSRQHKKQARMTANLKPDFQQQQHPYGFATGIPYLQPSKPNSTIVSPFQHQTMQPSKTIDPKNPPKRPESVTTAQNQKNIRTPNETHDSRQPKISSDERDRASSSAVPINNNPNRPVESVYGGYAPSIYGNYWNMLNAGGRMPLYQTYATQGHQMFKPNSQAQSQQQRPGPSATSSRNLGRKK